MLKSSKTGTGRSLLRSCFEFHSRPSINSTCSSELCFRKSIIITLVALVDSSPFVVVDYIGQEVDSYPVILVHTYAARRCDGADYCLGDGSGVYLPETGKSIIEY